MRKQLFFWLRLAFTCLISLDATSSFAQNCGCDVEIKQSDLIHKNVVDGINVRAGAKVCLMATIRDGNILFRNFNGTPSNPIVFINCGGKYVIKDTGIVKSRSYGIKFENSQHFRLTGTGDSLHKYGIEIIGSLLGVTLDGLSTNFEVDHLEIHDQVKVGLMAKTDPWCDSATWRGNFTMENVLIHDNYIHHTGGLEGIYAGNSFYAGGVKRKCGNDSILVYPHDVVGAKIFNNIIYNTGADGIQLGSGTLGCEIYNNRIEKYGQRPFDNRADQGSGIQIGEGTGGLCYNNFIRNEPPTGGIDRTTHSITCLGRGDNVIFNNIMLNPSESGMFIDERFPATIVGPGTGYKVFNNTIINPKKHGLLVYADSVEKNIIKNNIIVNPQLKYIHLLSSKVKVDYSNNYETRDINTVKFADPGIHDYHLQSSSSAINAGANVAAYGVGFDYDGISRPEQNAFDIGAFEYFLPIPYRINTGGLEIADSVKNWEKDKQQAPSRYLDSTSSNYTTGSDQGWSGVNNTGAPNIIFATNRYATVNRPMKWHFPVSKGKYTVRFFFAEKGGSGGVTATGQRVFDIKIEGALAIDDLDIFAEVGMGALKKEKVVVVSDGMLDIEFVRVTNHPQVNGIEIIRSDGTSQGVVIFSNINL